MASRVAQGSWCGAIGCKNCKKKNPDISFFRVPGKKDPERAKKWIQNCRRQDLLKKPMDYLYKNIFFCSNPFEPQMFMNATKSSLVWNAVPTLFSEIPNPPNLDKGVRKAPSDRGPPKPPDISSKVKETQDYIDSRLFLQKKKKMDALRAKNSMHMKKMKRMLKSKNDALRHLRKKKKAATTKTDVIEFVKPYVSQDQLVLLNENLNNKGKKEKRAYSDDFKHLAVSIYFKSTSTYNYLSKRLHLPQKSTISRWLSDITFDEGFDEDLFRLLEEKVSSLAERDRLVSIKMDEMSLSENMDYDEKRDQIIGVSGEEGQYEYPSNALTVMVRGIAAKWKQVVSYNFSVNALPATKVCEILFAVLSRLKTSGLNVVNFNADQGGNFSSLTGGILGVHEEKPYFVYEGMKIHVTCDAPHLIKSARNALLEHDIIVPTGLASWDHIRALYEHDRKQLVRLTPKLTAYHIDLKAIGGKMSVCKAAQVLSHTVACALRSYAHSGALPKDVLATADYCDYFNKIFDVLNCSRKHGVTQFQSALSLDNAVALTFMETATTWLKSLQILDKNKKVINSRFRFLNGFCLSLSSVRSLMEHLAKEYSHDFLLTRRLNQDGLENFFGVIRGRNGYNSNPSCLAFSRSVKIVLCN